MQEILVENPQVRWNEILGLEDAKRLVKEAVVYPLKYPQLFIGRFKPWRGILLYGPPGTGEETGVRKERIVKLVPCCFL